MSHSLMRENDLRGQTEPLAALIAVSAIAVAVGIYGVVLMDVLDSGEDRAVEEQAIDLIWDDIEDNGAFTAGTDLESEVTQESLPEGYNVYVNVSRYTNDGERETVGDGRFPADGVSAVEAPPDRAGTETRLVSIRMAPGDVRTGTLRVEVWEP